MSEERKTELGTDIDLQILDATAKSLGMRTTATSDTKLVVHDPAHNYGITFSQNKEGAVTAIYDDWRDHCVNTMKRLIPEYKAQLSLSRAKKVGFNSIRRTETDTQILLHVKAKY